MRNALTLLIALLAVGLFLPSAAFAQTPEEELEKRLDEIDITDADQLYEVAKWAAGNSKSKNVRKEGRSLMKEVLSLDEDHEDARKFLGYVYFNEKWMKKRDYEKALRKARESEMKEKGYIFFKGGWIKKADRRQWNKKWEKSDDGIWMSYEDVQRAKGYTLYDGEWLRITDDDRKRMEHHRKMTGDDILVISTKHFILHIDRTPEWAQKFAETLEKTYDWYVKEFQVPAGRSDNLFGRQAHIWSFETTQQFQDWITTYSDQYELSDEMKKRFRERPSGYGSTQNCLVCSVAEKPEDLINPMIHHVGSMLLTWHAGRFPPAWMREAIGHLAEQENSPEEYGRVNCSNQSRYGGDGGIAKKEFNTKDGRPRAKSIVKAGDERPLVELSMIELNSLNGDDLAQGYSIFDYLYEKRREDMAKWFNSFRGVKVPKGIQGSREKIGAHLVQSTVPTNLAESVETFEDDWRAFIKKFYR